MVRTVAQAILVLGATLQGAATAVAQAPIVPVPAERLPTHGNAKGSAPTAVVDSASIAGWIDGLTSDDFPTREDARHRLRSALEQPGSAAKVRTAFDQRLQADDLTLELRMALEELGGRRTDDAKVPAAAALDVQRIDALLGDLESGEFTRRDAAERVCWPRRVNRERPPSLLQRLQLRLIDGRATYDTLKRIDPLWEAAWRTWLKADPAATRSPPPDDAAIDAAVSRIVVDTTSGGADAVAQHVADRRLLYWMACDDVLPRVVKALERRNTAADISIAARLRIARLLAWTRPAMVAEIWSDGKLGTMQHLLIGVPNQPARAPNPSLFDRCTDETAHCVSGNLLTEGDYPVGIYFRPPEKPDTMPGPDLMFHLVNLPTPRRRLAYDAEVPLFDDERTVERLDETRRKLITARTVDRFLAERRLLTVREIGMLAFVDPQELSRMVGPYLSNVADERPSETSPSFHELFCVIVARTATSEAGPALVAAVESGRIKPADDGQSLRLDLLSLLNLAARAPWRDLDTWLAERIDRTDPIDIADGAAADFGASAAALLVRRASEEPSEFGLERSAIHFEALDDVAFRFSRPTGRDEVRRWWRERKTKVEKPQTP